ncbi:hypothetical protein DP44_1617 [Burkholderia pseudomallei]|nr:hypothetical protein DP44_1617 [Burkholderia pseudomallei]
MLLDHGFHDLQTSQLPHAHGMLMVISSSWPTMRSGSSNRRQHAPKPSNYNISTLPRCDMTTLLLHLKCR